MPSWAKVIERVTGWVPSGDTEQEERYFPYHYVGAAEEFSYQGGCLMHGHRMWRCCSGWDPIAAQSFPQSIHWLTTVTPEALQEIRDRDRSYCQTCSGSPEVPRHEPASECMGGRAGYCPNPAAHHTFVVGGLPPSWDTDSRDRALLLRALDEAIAAAEDC